MGGTHAPRHVPVQGRRRARRATRRTARSSSTSAIAIATRSTTPTASSSSTPGLVISGLSPDGKLVEMVELPDHPWFLGNQGHPEFKSRPTRPAPLFRDFIGAAVAFKNAPTGRADERRAPARDLPRPGAHRQPHRASRRACAAYCADALEAAGLPRALRRQRGRQTGSDTGNLIAELPGTAPGVLALSAHLDCVEPCRGVEPVIADGVDPLGRRRRSSAPTTRPASPPPSRRVRRLAESGEPAPHGQRRSSRCRRRSGLHGAKQLVRRGRRVRPVPRARRRGRARRHRRRRARPTTRSPPTFHGRAAHAGVAPEQGVERDRDGRRRDRRDGARPARRRARPPTSASIEGGTRDQRRRRALRRDRRVPLARPRHASRRCAAEMDAAMRAAAETHGGTRRRRLERSSTRASRSPRTTRSIALVSDGVPRRGRRAAHVSHRRRLATPTCSPRNGRARRSRWRAA